MMLDFSENTFFGFKDVGINHKFHLWQYENTKRLISYILMFTGFGYMIMGIVNIYYAPTYLQGILFCYQLFTIPSYLFFISFLAYKNYNLHIVEALLLSSPIIAAIFHAMIFSQMDTYSTYQVELYLMIFWIFTVSGLRLPSAIIAAFCVFMIGEIYPYVSFEDNNHQFIFHTMWMLIAMCFGIVGGCISYQSQKNTFLKELELEKNATIDKLTGLYNRTKLESILTLELDRAKRYHHNIGILLLDIDHFKQVNDTYGHLAGDNTLINISKYIQKNIRSSDYIFRWGGEEFLILCLEINQTDLMIFAEEIRSKVSQQDFTNIGEKTISIGATINHDNDTIDSIIQRADKALYEAKENGRNKACYNLE